MEKYKKLKGRSMNPRDGQEVVAVGSTSLSFKQLQDLYNDLTGKTESLSFNSPKSFSINFNDLEQLHHLIVQSSDSQGAIIQNESISVYHINGEKSVFSSFDRFRAYNRGNSSPIENIHLKYNALVCVSGSSQAKQYSISLHATSTAALNEKNVGVPLGELTIGRMFAERTIRCRVEFIDYVIGRNFRTAVEEWVNGLDHQSTPAWIAYTQRLSHWFPSTFSAITGAISLLFFAVRSQSLPQGMTYLQTYQVALWVAFYFVIATFAGTVLGKFAERNIDRFHASSVININKGDERLLPGRKKKGLRTLIGFGVSVASVLALNVLSNYVSLLILPN